MQMHNVSRDRIGWPRGLTFRNQSSHHGASTLTPFLAFALLACGGNAFVDEGNGSISTSASVGESTATNVLALSYVLAPLYPVVFDVTVDAQMNQLSLLLQPLAARDRTTAVGAAVWHGPFAVDGGGLYIAKILMGIPVEALPFERYDIDIDIELEALDPTCGVFGGLLIYTEHPGSIPVEFRGAYAMQPVSHEARVNPVIDCAGTHGAPL